jgi:serine/threonine-protein kinase
MSKLGECPKCWARIPVDALIEHARHCRGNGRAHDPRASGETSTQVDPESGSGSANDNNRWQGTIFGEYDQLEELGEGGMGVVFKARQIRLKRVVALKMLKPGTMPSSVQAQCLRTEAEAVARLDRSHILPIYETGAHDGRHYFSMKYVASGNLAELMARGGIGLSEREAPKPTARERQRMIARLLAQVAAAVHHAHQRGVLHRDLKLANILVDAEGNPYVTDFGLAKFIERDSGLTNPWDIMGSPSYMSPEQAAGNNKAITTATDIYSLGAII